MQTTIGKIPAGLDHPFFLIAGNCVIESPEVAYATADRLKEITTKLGIPLIYKSSYDKANRSSYDSFREPGMDKGLEILSMIRDKLQIPVLTDVHSVAEVEPVSRAVDVIQIPAFLCRQTDLIQACGSSGCAVNIKKGQFLSPQEMDNVVQKAIQAGGKGRVSVCERGSSFGYNNLVVDMRSLAIMRDTGCPVVFDATHSVQLPGQQGKVSGGKREFIPILARSAVAAGIAGIFMETHPEPDKALSDGPNAWPLADMESLLGDLVLIDRVVKGNAMLTKTSS